MFASISAGGQTRTLSGEAILVKATMSNSLLRAGGALGDGISEADDLAFAEAGNVGNAFARVPLLDSAQVGVSSFMVHAPVDNEPGVGPSSDVATGADRFTGSSIDPVTVAGGATLEIASS